VKLFVFKENRLGWVGSGLPGRAGFLLLLSGAGLVFAQSQETTADKSHQAKELMAAGRYEEAIPIYRQLVKAVPGNAGLMLNLGLAEEFAGHPEQAIPQLENVLRAQPTSVPALTSLGMARLQMKQPGLAIAPLSKLVGLQPGDRNARGMLASALLATDHAEEAAAQYRALGESDASDAKAWYGLGSAYEAEANQAFGRLMEVATESAYSAVLLGEASFQRGQYRSAFFFYKKAEEAMPKLRGVHADMAQVYAKTEHADWGEVEQRREAELAAEPCAAKTAECLFVGGKLLEASHAAGAQPETLFWKTKALNALASEAFSHLEGLPESPELHGIKANILKERRQFKEAAEEWRAALRLAPGDVGLQRELMTTLFLARDYETLMPMLDEALRGEPKAADLNFMMGASLLQTEQPEKGVPFLEASLQADQKMLSVHASLGLALARTGKAAEAIPHLEKALETDEDGSLHYQLARAYQSAGKADRSREMMAQYQSIVAKSESAKEELAKEAEIVGPAQ
jgi:tetratricopeptide (TPR) repeat protein